MPCLCLSVIYFGILFNTDDSEEEDVFDHSPVLQNSLEKLILHVGDTLNYQV